MLIDFYGGGGTSQEAFRAIPRPHRKLWHAAVHERERRNSFPDVDVLCATNVSEDWEEAVKSASKMPLTPGPGIKKGANPFAFSNKDKLSHLKKALVSNAANGASDTPILTFAQRLKAMS